MWRQNPSFLHYESFNQLPYPIMGNYYNMYGSPGFQPIPSAYPQQMPYQMPSGVYEHGHYQPNYYPGEQGFHPEQPYYNQQNVPRPIQNFSPFVNPLQINKNQQPLSTPYPNPYPKQSFLQKKQPSGFQSVMNQFKTQDGSFDVTKVMNTAGQMVGTVGQVQNMFKGLGGFLKFTQ